MVSAIASASVASGLDASVVSVGSSINDDVGAYQYEDVVTSASDAEAAMVSCEVAIEPSDAGCVGAGCTGPPPFVELSTGQATPSDEITEGEGFCPPALLLGTGADDGCSAAGAELASFDPLLSLPLPWLEPLADVGEEADDDDADAELPVPLPCDPDLPSLPELSPPPGVDEGEDAGDEEDGADLSPPPSFDDPDWPSLPELSLVPDEDEAEASGAASVLELVSDSAADDTGDDVTGESASSPLEPSSFEPP